MTLWQDVWHGWRMLARRPGFTAAAGFSLALGIAANTVIFSIIYAAFLMPLRLPDSKRLVVVWTPPLDRLDQRASPNYSSYRAFKEESRSFAAVGGMNSYIRVLGAERYGEPAERLNSQAFTASMFSLIGVKPLLGRFFTEQEDQIDHPASVVLISNHLWTSRFNGDKSIVGRPIILDGIAKRIVGVMPELNFVRDDFDLWEPLAMTRAQTQSRGSFFTMIGRLRPGVSINQADAEMKAIVARLAAADPDHARGNGARLQSFQEALYQRVQSPLLILQAGVAFVLLISCANVAGLLLARARSRRTEIAIRAALGAGRTRVLRQLLSENLPLSLVSGLFGILLSWAGLKSFVLVAPSNFPRLQEMGLSLPVLAFTIVLSFLTGIVSGVIPAIQASKLDLASELKESGRSGTEGVSRHRVRSAMVVLQIAFTLVLLVGAGLMINSFVRVQREDLGADPKGLLTFNFRLSQSEAITPAGMYRGVSLWAVSPRTTAAFDRMLHELGSVPGIVSAAGISRSPLNSRGIEMPFLIEGQAAPPVGRDYREQTLIADYFAITPNFFHTLSIPILRGRDFNTKDTAAAPRVIIISQTTARRFFGSEDPIGKHLTLDYAPAESPREIVGIVGDVVLSRMQRKQVPAMYVPYTQQTPQWPGTYWPDRAGMYFVVRPAGDPMRMVRAIRRAAATTDPNNPIGNIRTVEENLDEQVEDMRLYLLLLGVFGTAALVLASVGIYGVTSCSVAERTREMGIRIALGAAPSDVFSLILRQSVPTISIGLALGLAGALALTRFMTSMLVGVSATDPGTFFGVMFLLASVAILACVVPTRRATSIDPTLALRQE